MPKQLDTPLRVRVSPPMRAQLQAVATELRRDLSWVIREALERYLRERAKREGEEDVR